MEMDKNLPENQHLLQKTTSFTTNDDAPRLDGADDADVTVPDPDAAVGTDDDVKSAEKLETQEKEEEETQKEEEEKEKEEDEEEKKEDEPDLQYNLHTILVDVDQFLLTPHGSRDREEDSAVEIPHFIDKFLDLVDAKIEQYNNAESNAKEKQCRVPEDESSFLEAVDRISKLNTAIHEMKLEEEKNSLINRIGSTQQRAISYLEEEFRFFLEESKNRDVDVDDTKGDRCAVPEAEPDHQQIPVYSNEILSYLKKIANQMISGGYESECYHVYIVARRNKFEEALLNLGFEKHSIDDIQKMSWESMECEIGTWIRTFEQCAIVLFSGERNLAESIFSAHPKISANLFNNLTHGIVIQLLNFSEGVAMTKRSAEKLFKLLDMYEALRDMLPKMESLFPEEYAEELRTEIATTRTRLGEAAICIFCDLENSIRADTGKIPVPGGAVHPLARYTINYLKYACEYRTTLEQIFKEHAKIERADSTSRPRYEGEQAPTYNPNSDNQSPFSVELMRVMELLDSNLEAKSKLYRDIALSSIFMMNNGRYILQKIKGSPDIHELVGDTWYRKRSSDLRQYHKNYQRETWGKLLGYLNHEGLTWHGKVNKPVLKERFKGFNALFEEIHKTQSSWIISDEQLQSELRVSISAVMIPAYRSFLARFSQYLDPGRQTEKYIKLQPEDIETYIDELFDGNPTSMARRRT
ncbi:exocyst complex component EXO70B1-like [Cucurbita pepo subsp. pepo]|uniref:exocyst complex component EXO70B1-like n=1 Tax=Cucurbita pepo subsp. pepo TaxID=3664 RepID=UPI000C9D6A8F|nr:exocyst complex component EXO70B1-like [Cucurbita pepo subsp. pepo]